MRDDPRWRFGSSGREREPRVHAEGREERAGCGRENEGHPSSSALNMAEFQVQAMADSATPEDLPQRGRVTEVCREWLMHEDFALAHKLQNEEYQSRLVSNRERNQILRQDTPKARQEQNREDQEAAMAQMAYEMYLAQQEARDAEMAAMLSQKLNVDEMEALRQQEEKDMVYARNLMEREKESIRQERELRQVEREAAYLGINSGSDNVALLSRKEPRDPDLNGTTSSDRSARSNISDLSDLSDFCRQPTEDMDEEQIRELQEEQDADQDGKRRGDLLHQDQLMAIEAQDRELAKVLQEQERAKAKKAREKARQKALQKKQARASQLLEGDVPAASKQTQAGNSRTPVDAIRGDPQAGPSGYRLPSPQQDTDYGSRSPTYASPDSPREDLESTWQPPPRGSQLQRPNSLDLPGCSRVSQPLVPIERTTKYAHQFPVGKTNKPRLPDPDAIEVVEESSSSSTEHNLSMGFTNIACAIDPTYQRRVRQGELASPQATLQSSSSSSTTSSGTGFMGPSITSPVSPLPPPVFDDDDDYPVPPYMPIQGQRRTASLEKNRRQKPSKEKNNSKDGCKQQ
ncbi:stress response protein NST1-like isoform X2 [Penaeus chinensis]|uniref:stress response protein NST1-like isoform X2 n=1 Tax=Penaeus chinensis TaxID=139456 RepID=UPI001FB658FF|nr:stress response protein NST1-like isoform X2 [Penaeus chinensis]